MLLQIKIFKANICKFDARAKQDSCQELAEKGMKMTCLKIVFEDKIAIVGNPYTSLKLVHVLYVNK
jgi:hypothetical protein